MKDNNNALGYKRIDEYNDETIRELAAHYKEILRLIGENPEREGLIDSPVRIAKAMQFFTHGYDLEPENIDICPIVKESALRYNRFRRNITTKNGGRTIC